MALASLFRGIRGVSRLWRRTPIIVVSGLPRSGTSMMMRMLAAGGVPILSDAIRSADESNPVGYFEFEPVKDLAKGAPSAWLDEARGKAVKIIAFLLTWLPETHEYRVLFMRRDLGEIVASQREMLARRGEPSASDDEHLPGIYAEHLETIARFLSRRKCFSTLDVDYRSVISHPEEEARRIAAFLRRDLDIAAMAAAVDSRLYRQRAQNQEPST